MTQDEYGEINQGRRGPPHPKFADEMTDTTDFPPDAMLGYGFQHEETGNTTFVSADEADEFARLNPRWSRIGPAYLLSDRASRAPAWEASNAKLRQCLGFFLAVIKSGETWTDTCQMMYDAATQPPVRLSDAILHRVAQRVGETADVWEGIGARDVEAVLRIASEEAAATAEEGASRAPAQDLTDDELDKLWLYRANIHDGQLMPQLRDFARAVLAAAPSTQAPQYDDSVPPIWETLGAIGREELARAPQAATGAPDARAVLSELIAALDCAGSMHIEKMPDFIRIIKAMVPARAWLAEGARRAGQPTEQCKTCKGLGYTDPGDPETGATSLDYPCPDCAGITAAPVVREVVVNADYKAMWQEVVSMNQRLTAAIAATPTPADDVRAAILDYHFALDSREHGGLAARHAVFRVEAALDMPWIQGAEAARRALSSQQEGGKP